MTVPNDDRRARGQADKASGEHPPSETSEASSVYRRLRALLGDPSQRGRDAQRRSTKAHSDSSPFGAGRDPAGLAGVIDGMTQQLGWNSPLARGELLSSWPALVGDEVAAHSTPAGIDDGVLTVQCDSTAWATQLRLMRGQIVTTIAQKYPDAMVSSVKFLGPGAPSWKRGPRSIPGRGPRDTYG